MERLSITLIMDLSEKAPEGPGWYVYAAGDGDYLVPPTTISSEAAYEASRALQEALQSTEGELPRVALPQLAESGSRLIRQALTSALEYAEAQAVKVALLRKKISKLPPEPKSPTQTSE